MTRSDTRTAEILLRIKADKRAAAEANKTLKAFDSTLNDLARDRQLDRLATAMSKAAAEGRKTNQIFRQARKELQSFGASDREVERVVRQFTRLRTEAARAGRATNLAALGREFRLQAPAVPIPGTGVSSEQGARLIEVAGKLGLSFKDLAIAGGAAGVAIVGVAIAFNQFKATIGAVATTLDEVTKARQTTAGFLTDATTQVTEAERDRLILERDRLQNQRLQAAGDLALQTEGAQGSGLLGQFIVGLGTTFQAGPIGDAIKKVDELDAQLAAANVQIDAYNQALDSNILVTNDAEEAERQREAALDQTIIRQTQLQRQFATADDLQAFDELIEKRKRDRDILQQVIASADLSDEALAGLNAELRTLNTDISTLQISIRPFVEEFDGVRRALERAKEGSAEARRAFQEEVQFTQRLKQAAQGLADFAANFAARIQDIQRRVSFAIEDAERKRGIDLSEARRKAGLDEQEAIRESGVERLDIVRRTQQAINRILRRSRLAEQQAIQDRDAIALFAARERRNEEVQTEQESRDERLREQQRGLAEELRQIRNNLGERLRTIRRGAAETIRRTRITAQRTIALETEKFQREFALRVRNASQQLGITQQQVIDQVRFHAAGATAMVGITAQMWQQMINLGISAVSGIGGAAGRRTLPSPSGAGASRNIGQSPNLRGFAPTAFHRGGDVTRTGQTILLAGERVIPRGGAGGLSIAINGLGMTNRQVGREVERQLDEYGAGRQEAAATGAFS